MNPGALQRIFDVAVALPAPDRPGFLDQACRDDPALRTHLEQLLAASDEQASIFDGAPEQITPAFASSLRQGKRLGPYEIVERLGVGGMGEVFRASDTRLNRPVAIKVLPAHLAANRESQSRFGREAKAIAALNHPHVCALYDVGYDAGITFLVMEFIEGETLEERLLPGLVSIEEGIRIGVAIADALAKAHARGIVHRDIKPSNVMVTPDGLVKVLDFGLAKLQPDSLGRDATTVVTNNLSDSGKIVGTVAYMSPEQAEGKPIDYRSDLFSFGVLLYEMFTGSRPFTGETPVSVISSILRDIPPPVRQLNPQLPTHLDALIATCLAKDPNERVHAASELRDGLQLLQRDNVRSITSRAKEWHLGWLILVSVILLAIVGIMYFSGARFQNRSQRAADLESTQLTATGDAFRAAASPDGQYVTYIRADGSGSSLWLQQIVSGTAAQLVPADRLRRRLLTAPTISPDAAFIDFAWGPSSADLSWWRIPLVGGVPKKIADSIASAIGWSPDGKRVAFVRRDRSLGATQLVVSDAFAANERVVVTRQAGSLFFSLGGPGHNRPSWSFDGRLIALLISNGTGAALDVVDVENGHETLIPLPLSQGVGNVVWVDGFSLILNGQTPEREIAQLWRVSYPDGRLTRLTNDLTDYTDVSCTRDGTELITTRTIVRGDLWIGDADGQHLAIAVPPTNEHSARSVFWLGPRLSYVSAPIDISKVFVYEPGAAPEAIASVPLNRGVVGSSDGTSIVLAGSEGLIRTDARGQHPVQLVPWNSEWPVVTANSQTVLFIASPNGRKTLWSIPIKGGTPNQVTNFVTTSVDVGGDDRELLLSVLRENGKAEHMICPLPACESPQKVDTSRALGSTVRWTPDGGSIAYADVQTGTNIFVQALAGGEVRPLTHFSDGYSIEGFAWSPDKRRLAVTRLTQLNDVVMFKGLRVPR